MIMTSTLRQLEVELIEGSLKLCTGAFAFFYVFLRCFKLPENMTRHVFRKTAWTWNRRRVEWRRPAAQCEVYSPNLQEQHTNIHTHRTQLYESTAKCKWRCGNAEWRRDVPLPPQPSGVFLGSVVSYPGGVQVKSRPKTNLVRLWDDSHTATHIELGRKAH